jgi:serine/threonine protein kinase
VEVEEVGDKVCDSMYKGKPKMDIEQKHCEAAFEGQLMAPGELDFNVNTHALKIRCPTLMSIFRHVYPKGQEAQDLGFGRITAYPLGGGAFGTTVIANLASAQKIVAIKFIKAKHACDKLERKRFRDEALLLRRLTEQMPEGRRFLPRFEAYGLYPCWPKDEGLVHLPFIAMQLVIATSKTMNSFAKAPSLKKLSEAAANVADAIHWLHNQGYLHGDLKMDNIWWDGAGMAGIMDLGCHMELMKRQGDTELTAVSRVHAKPLKYWLPEEVCMGTRNTQHKHKRERVRVTAAFDWFSYGTWLVKFFWGVSHQKKDHVLRDKGAMLKAIAHSSMHRKLMLIAPAEGVQLLSLIESLLQTKPRERPQGNIIIGCMHQLKVGVHKGKHDTSKHPLAK